MKVFVTTGCGNIIQGGADMWTNNFILAVNIKFWSQIIHHNKEYIFIFWWG